MLQRLMKPYKKKDKNESNKISNSKALVKSQTLAKNNHSESMSTLQQQFELKNAKSFEQNPNSQLSSNQEFLHTQSSPAFRTADQEGSSASEEAKAFIPSPGGISVYNKETRPANINTYHPQSETQSLPNLPQDSQFYEFQYPNRNVNTDGDIVVDGDIQALKSIGNSENVRIIDDQVQDPKYQEIKMYKYLLEQQNLPKLMRGSVRKSWMDTIDNPTEQGLLSTIKDMKKVIQDLQLKDSGVKKQIEQHENQKQNLARCILKADIEIQKSEKGRELDSKYLFKQDQVLIKMQQNSADQCKLKKSLSKKNFNDSNNKKGKSQSKGSKLSEPGKSTIQNKIQPSVVSTRPDPALVKSNKILTNKVDQIEQEINMLLTQFIQNQQKTEAKLQTINQTLLSQKMISNDKILKALSAQIKIAGKSYQSAYKATMQTMQKGKNDLEKQINQLKEEQQRFLSLKRDCIEDKKQLFNHQREIGEYKVDFMIRQERGLNAQDDANDDQKLEHAYAASNILAKLKERYSRVQNSDLEDQTFIQKLPNYGEVMSSDSITQILKKNFSAQL